MGEGSCGDLSGFNLRNCLEGLVFDGDIQMGLLGYCDGLGISLRIE